MWSTSCIRGRSPDESIESQVAGVEQDLGFDSSKVRFENLEPKKLDVAANMFMHMFTCPNSEHWNKMAKSWTLFGTELLNHSPNEVTLTFNRLLKIKSTNENDIWTEDESEQFFRRITDKLSLKHGLLQSLLSGEESVLDNYQITSKLSAEGK